MSAKIVNLTPHSVHLIERERVAEIQPSGLVARVILEEKRIGRVMIDGRPVQLVRLVATSVENLPDPRPKTFYIVSAMVAQAVRRDDLLVPYQHVRRGGCVVGCRGLANI